MGAILWLASYPKSGNTWLRAFLHNLMRNPAQSYDINQLSHFTFGDSQAPRYQKFDPRPATEYTVDDVLRMRPLVQQEMTKASPDTIFVKTHNAFLELKGQPLISNEVTAGALYVIRDPRDVTISYSHHLGLTLDQTIDFLENPDAATGIGEKNVYEHLSTWSTHVHSWTHTLNPSLHVVRYEDMLDAPMKTFGGIAKFLGFTPPRDRLDKAIKLSSFKVLQAQERRSGFNEKSRFADAFFREGKSGQWRKLLSPEQVARIEETHGEQMRRFGYL
jgi:hypothetical protein